jgi:hypothetical protein
LEAPVNLQRVKGRLAGMLRAHPLRATSGMSAHARHTLAMDDTRVR